MFSKIGLKNFQDGSFIRRFMVEPFGGCLGYEPHQGK